jgi:hypothetical protein
MNIYRGDVQAKASGPMYGESQAIAKIAFLTSVFEKLVAEAGLRRERIEQMLAELCEDRSDVKPLGSTIAVVETVKRAA